MERLPLEIQTKIYNDLTFQDHLTCLAVSKVWYRCLYPIFYAHLDINRESRLQETMTFFRDNKELAKEVKHIKIQCTRLEFHIYSLPILFPNVQKIILQNTPSVCHFESQDIKAISVPWTKIQEIEITETSTMFKFLLSMPCLNLTRIYINIMQYRTANQDLEMYASFQNAPNLNHLVLINGLLRIDYLEKLHKSAPHLRSLVLKQCRLSLIHEEAIMHQPTLVKLHTLHVDINAPNIFSHRKEDLLPLYILNKYCGLREFSFSSNIAIQYFDTFDYSRIQAALPCFFSRCPNLHDYQMQFCPFTGNTINIIKRENIYLNHTTLFQWPTIDIRNQCQALYQANQGIQKLSFMFADRDWRMLVIRNKARFQENARTLSAQIYNMEQPEVCVLSSLIQFRQLTHLSITVTTGATNLLMLYRYLNEIRTLECIQLKSVYIYETSAQHRLSMAPCNIKTIEISELTFFSRHQADAASIFFHNILPCCPKLEHFSIHSKENIMLRSDTNYQPSNVILDFESHAHLKSVEIYRFAYEPVNYCYLIRTHLLPDQSGFYFIQENQIIQHHRSSLNYVTLKLCKPIQLNSHHVQ